MKILCLYHNACAIELFDWLQQEGHEIVLCNEQITSEWCQYQRFDLAVSYTYRYILTKEILDALNDNVVNLHNSYLPWNRGADPNIWSIIEDTPRGVTLHYMNEHLDKGFIITQKLIYDGVEGTLKSFYYHLDEAAKDLFKEAFHYYPYWKNMRKIPFGEGTYHSVKAGEHIRNLIDSFDMSVADFREKVRVLREATRQGCSN